MIHDEHSRSCLKGQFAAFEEKKASTIWKKSSVTTICKTSFWDGHSKKEIIKKINAEFTFTSFRYFYLFFTNITATLLLVRLLLIFVSVVLQIFLQSSQIEVHKSSNNCEVTNFLEVLQPTRTIYHNLPTGKFPQLLHILIIPLFFVETTSCFLAKVLQSVKSCG